MKSFLKLALLTLLASQSLGQYVNNNNVRTNNVGNANSHVVNTNIVNTNTYNKVNAAGNTANTVEEEDFNAEEEEQQPITTNKTFGNGNVNGNVNTNTMATKKTAGTAGATGTTGTAGTAGITGGLASVYTECKNPGEFVLTFDDGPGSATTERCLKILKENGVPATFFVNAANYVDLVNSPEAQAIVKHAYDEGHDIGSHTYEHKDLFAAMDDGTLELNVDSMNEVIEGIIGRRPVFFRPPLGNGGFTKEYCASHGIAYDPRTEEIRQFLGERGMKVIMWNADTQDWNNKGNYANSIAELGKSVNPKSPQTSSFITLLHDVHEYTVDTILQRVIDYVRQKGYHFVPLHQCIGEAPYLDGYNPNKPLILNITTPKATDSEDLLGPIDLESSSMKSYAFSFVTLVILAIINVFLY